MKKTITASLLIVIVLTTFSFFPAITADENIDVEINIVGSNPRYHQDKSVLVAGMWNYIKVKMNSDKPRNLRIVLFKGDEIPENKNISSYYEWKYEHNSDSHWVSLVNYNDFNYIDIDKCKKTENIYTFCVGVSDTFQNIPYYKEEWKIEVYENNNKIHSEYFYLEKPTKGIAHSHGDVIYFYVDPFTEMVTPGSDFFTLKNTGNVPLDISISYPRFSYLIEFTSYTERIIPAERANYHVSLHSNSWSPQLITDIGEGIGKVPDEFILDDTDAFVVLKTATAVSIPDLRIFVGHSRHELVENLFDIGLSFQYEKNINMDEGEIRDITAYISGDGRLKLSIWTDDTDNIRVKKIFKNDKEITSPFNIHSTSSSEQKITVRVEAIRERKSGDINYKLEALDGRSKTYQTHIEINPLSSSGITDIPGVKSDTGLGSNSVVTLIVVISIFMVLIYMIVSQLRSSRR